MFKNYLYVLKCLSIYSLYVFKLKTFSRILLKTFQFPIMDIFDISTELRQPNLSLLVFYASIVLVFCEYIVLYFSEYKSLPLFNT